MTERAALILAWLTEKPAPRRYRVTAPGVPKRARRFIRRCHRVFYAELISRRDRG